MKSLVSKTSEKTLIFEIWDQSVILETMKMLASLKSFSVDENIRSEACRRIAEKCKGVKV